MKWLDIPSYVYVTVIGTIIAAGILAISSLWAGSLQKREGDQDKADLRKQVQELKEELSNKSDEIRYLNKELYNYQTGGDSYCYLTFTENSYKNTLVLYLNHVGNYPIQNLQICISDVSSIFQAVEKKTAITLPSGKLVAFEIKISGSDNSEPVNEIQFPKGENVYLGISFKTGDGRKVWYQRVLFSDYLNHFPNVRNIAPNTKYPHVIHSQVFKIKEDKEPTYFNYSGENQKRRGNDRLIFTQEILYENHSINSDLGKKLDWAKYPFEACNFFISNFDHIVPLKENK